MRRAGSSIDVNKPLLTPEYRTQPRAVDFFRNLANANGFALARGARRRRVASSPDGMAIAGPLEARRCCVLAMATGRVWRGGMCGSAMHSRCLRGAGEGAHVHVHVHVHVLCVFGSQLPARSCSGPASILSVVSPLSALRGHQAPSQYYLGISISNNVILFD